MLQFFWFARCVITISAENSYFYCSVEDSIRINNSVSRHLAISNEAYSRAEFIVSPVIGGFTTRFLILLSDTAPEILEHD